jgi:hypothetical protein
MGILIALGSTATTSTPLVLAGRRSYVRPAIFMQSSASGLKKSTDPLSGGQYLPALVETSAEPTPGSGDNPLSYPDLPEVEFEGTTYRMTQDAAAAWSVQLANRMSAQAIAEEWDIQDDFEWRGPLSRLAGQWIGDGAGAIPAEEDSAAYDAMFAAWMRGKQHVANTDYPNSAYGNYALGWPRPFLNPTGLTQRRGLPTTGEIAWVKTHFWDPQQRHYVHGHFKPMTDPVLSTPAKFREAHRLWASSEKTRLLADGVPEAQWSMSVWLPHFVEDPAAGYDSVATGLDFLRAGFEGMAEAGWPNVDVGGIENTPPALLGLSSVAELAEAVLTIADETVFVDGLPGPSSTFQTAQPVTGQPTPAEPGLPTPLKDHQKVQRQQIAATILRLGVPAKYYQRGLGTGIDVVVYISDSAAEVVGGTPERSRHSLNNRRRQSWRLICLAGTHLADPGLGVANDPDLEAVQLDARSMVRLENSDVFAIAAEHLGLPSNEVVKLRVPETFKLVDRSYWSVEVSA